MSDNLTDLILSLTPEDGSSIGNGAMMARLRDYRPDLTEEAYNEAKDALIEEGVLGRGPGQGGSIYRADVAELRLSAPVATEPKAPASNAPRKKAARKSNEPTEVLSYRHGETRVNNPEVGMVHANTDPDGEKTRWSYDPHLDPVLNFDSARGAIETLIDNALASDDPERMKDALHELKRLQAPYLNWTGKAEKTSFEVDTVSLHVHERVDPATILSELARKAKGSGKKPDYRQASFWEADFERLPLRKALEWYKHPMAWMNRLVAGDSLLVMNSLLTKESMGGKVQMIYIDPPYGIKYGSNFQPFTGKKPSSRTDKDEDLTAEPEMIKAFRDTWELGVHSYLAYLRDRLLLSHQLLSEEGSLFVQISDDNLHLVRNVVEEIFGRENFVVTVLIKKKGSQKGGRVDPVNDYLVWTAKNRKRMKYNQLYSGRESDEEITSDFSSVLMENGSTSSLAKLEKIDGVRPRGYRDNLAAFREKHPKARIFKQEQSTGGNPGKSQAQLYKYHGIAFDPGIKRGLGWKASADPDVEFSGMRRLDVSGRLHIGDTQLAVRRFPEDFGLKAISNWWDAIGGASNPVYVVQTNERILERCIQMTTDPGDLVLDPTCGSGTTAFVAEKWGRRWITCDTSRVAITLAKQRLMTASFDYYALRYPNEGLKGGFDYKTVPHIMAARIANNTNIDTIYDEDHPKIVVALADLNTALKSAHPLPIKPTQGYRKGKLVSFLDGDVLEEWEVPFDLPSDWPEAAKAPFEAFHTARKAMQRRMDQSIADHAVQETLYDKPRIDKNKLRITGPFSVEAVPAPTVLSLDETLPSEEAGSTVARSGETSRQSLWRDELLKTGVRGKGGNMMTFAEFETLPSTRFLHASGSVADTGERVVVSFGPEHAALEQRQVEEAMNEAYGLMPKPKFLLFCAFTFDPEAAKDIDEMNVPGMTFLKVQMNTDLLTEDLKKKRASNESFWLMGQPEVEVRKRADGLWEVEVHGFDYFDPRPKKNPNDPDLISGGKKQIAMWSLDTDYDQRSLMPHQVFFPMADAKGGWNRLRKTVRAELDEDLLEQFHGTVSLPFEAGDNKRVAVKIVDDRGIESLKIVPLED